MLLGDLAHRGGALWPSRPAFIWGGRSRTYGEPARRVERLSAVFAAAGVRAGGRIALLTVNAARGGAAVFGVPDRRWGRPSRHSS
jgi:acyl-CoA synthetase (AMP-forming)/AMP-acid ligase II